MRPLYYAETGTLYAEFEAYESARLFYEKGLENLTYTDELLAVRTIWNNLGLIYRNYYRDFEKSDSCFAGIFNTKPQNPLQPSPSQDPNTRFTQQDEYKPWVAIAKGNLGTNRYLCGDYDQAIPLLTYSIEETTKNNPFNYPYAAGKALTLSEIYLIRQEPEPVKRYAGEAYGFLEKERIRSMESKITNTYLLMQYYNVLSRCCRLSGDSFTAFINEYRVREAARLLSDPANNHFTIESLGLSSGFSDRTTFYRVFKKSAGVSPSTFRRKALEMSR